MSSWNLNGLKPVKMAAMTIGIIGAGHIGQAVAKRLSSAGLEASISNSRGPESLSSLVRELGPGIKAATRQDAAKADIVFLAVPWTSHTDVVSDLPPWNGRIVIDAMNAVSVGPDGVAAVDLGGRPSSEVCRRASARGSRGQGVQHADRSGPRQRSPPIWRASCDVCRARMRMRRRR